MAIEGVSTAGVLDCPECKETGKTITFAGPMAPMDRGRHRRREHGVVGSSRTTERRRSRPADRAPRAPRVPGAPKPSTLRADLRKGFKLAGKAVTKMGDSHCGEILEKRSGSFCDALADVLQENPRLKAWIQAVSRRSPYIALVVAGGELAIPIAAHHGGAELAARAILWWRGRGRPSVGTPFVKPADYGSPAND